MGGDKENPYRVVRAQQSEPRSVLIVLVGREEAEPLGFPSLNEKAMLILMSLYQILWKYVASHTSKEPRISQRP
ncbi:MAG: hypothetical protein COA52_20010 [Hyphomicrobiales bacterium]|nr:MAG: hypothetical protein COA52_20010 [Hyphomicrobiales bacterium]